MTNGLCKKESTANVSSPRRKPPKLSKPSVSVVEAEKSPNLAKKTLINGHAKSNSFDMKLKQPEKKEDNTKHSVNHADGKLKITNEYRINITLV